MKKLTLILVLAAALFLAGCESTDRIAKNISSEYGGGLDRIMYVYSNDGELLRTYEGKFDIKPNEFGNTVLFDLNGKRVQLFNVQIIVEED